VEGNAIGLVALAEFETPTIFDHDCDFNRSTSYMPLKFVEIIQCTLYINRNVSIIFS
jgi:hypothetical protein